MRRILWGLVAAVVAALSPGAATAAFTLTLVSAPAGYQGPTAGTEPPGFPQSLRLDSGSLSNNDGRLTVDTSEVQTPTFASIATTFQLLAATTPPTAGSVGYVPAGTYQFRIREDAFTLPPGSDATIGISHTSIVPFTSPPGTPLVTTAATSQVPGNAGVAVNGSPMLTQMFEAMTPKPDGVYTLDQLVTINLPAGGSGQFSVTSYLVAAPAPPALLLAAVGMPLLGFGTRRLRRGGGVPPVEAV